jgi:hypothetical protein
LGSSCPLICAGCSDCWGPMKRRRIRRGPKQLSSGWWFKDV